jgi:hypothetical protein
MIFQEIGIANANKKILQDNSAELSFEESLFLFRYRMRILPQRK